MQTEKEKAIAAARKYTTKYESLVKLTTELGCKELKNLEVAGNAK